MPLAALDLLVAVVARWATHLAGLDALRIDAGSAGRLGATLLAADLTAQGIHQLLPGTVLLPSDEVVPGGALGDQVMGEIVPLDTRAGLVEQGVDDLAQVHGAGPATALGGRDELLERVPLLVAQVRGVTLAHGRGSAGCPVGATA